MLINQDIKNFVQGISQQPATLRDPEQLESQLNGYSSEASGLQKRPPTLFEANIGKKATASTKPLIHFINRDETEKYILFFNGDGLDVYDLKGNKKTVNFSGNSKKYISLNSPRTRLKCVTIADYTFIVNKDIVTKISNTTSNNIWSTQGVLVNIKSGQYGRTYRVSINGTTVATFETPDGSDKTHTKQIATDYIAEQLAAQARTNGWNVTTGSSWLYLTGKAINTLSVYDGYNNQAAFGIYKTTQKFTNLPPTAPANFTVRVAGEKGSNTDDYYVYYDANEQVWKETVKPGLKNKIDVTTMPHILVRESNGTFTLRTAEWMERTVGDEDSNPLPSFINQTINDIFYHRNRLGFLSGENVILTRSADFFNFWMTSATEVHDTDPIDLAVSDNKISTLYHAVPFDAELIVFSEGAQFALKSDNVLSPKDAVLTPAVTHFGCSLDVAPINAGRNIYFTAERSEYTTVREFFTAADNTDSKDAQDITSHVPSYIPNGVYKILPSNTENIMLFLTEGAKQSAFVYKYLFIDGVRQQASWSRWDFNDNVYGGAFIDGYLYLIIERNDYMCLERISFTFNTKDFAGQEPYRVLLDSKRLVPKEIVRTYDSDKDETTINIKALLGNTYDSTKSYSVVCKDGTYVSTNTNDIVKLQGDYRTQDIVCGINYPFVIKMSTVYIKKETDRGIQAVLEGRLQLRQMWFSYADSGYFKVKVRVLDKEEYEYINSQRLLGTKQVQLNRIPFTTGQFKVPIQSLNTNCEIFLESDAPLPISLIGAGWIGNYIRRTQQY